MPTYDFECTECGHRFSLTQSIAEREEAKVTCPGCNKEKVKQVVTMFTAKTTRKS